jgi:hypothetical protein
MCGAIDKLQARLDTTEIGALSAFCCRLSAVYCLFTLYFVTVEK